MPKKLSRCGLIVCGVSAFALMISLASVGSSADNLDQKLGLTIPSPRPNPPSLRPAPTPTQAETVRPARGDLKTHQSSNNNQMDFNPKP